MIRVCISISLFLTCLNVAVGGEADDARRKGIAALKESQTDSAKIVEAARQFSKAASLYEAGGNADLAVEMNSYLYWCKKKMTAADIEEFIKDNKAAVRLSAVQKAPALTEAQKWFDRAESFARTNPNEHLLIAIRFFEVADRFKGSDVSLKAQDRSLQEMQANMRPPAAGAQSGLPPNLRERQIRIEANAPFGYAIGPFKKGETIVLMYESGTWRTPADNAAHSPNAPDCPEHLKVALALVDIKKLVLSYHGIVNVGPGKGGVKFVADIDWEFLVLRINHQVPDISRNMGAVVYKLLTSAGIGDPPDISKLYVAKNQPQQPAAPPPPAPAPAPPPPPVAKKAEPEKPVVRIDVPAAAKIRDAEKSIREIFKDEMASTQAAVKAELSTKLLKEAEKTKDDQALKFVLFREARDAAAAANNAGTALLAYDLLLKHFNVNRVEESAAAFKKLADACKAREASRELAEGAAPHIERALASEEFDLAKTIALAVEPAAARIGDTELLNRIKELGAKAAEIQREQATSKALLDKIAANPNDPIANLAAGRHFCFVKGDWARGLPALAKGSQPDLKALAEKDLVDPQEPAAIVAVADAWFEAAEKNAGQRAAIMARAAELYARALPGLPNLARLKTEKRFAAAQIAATQAPSGPLPKTDSFTLPNGIRLDSVLVSPGKFNMGSTAQTVATPVRAVTITKAFYMGKFEVTQEQWEAVMGGNPATFKAPRRPVEGVTWSAARNFCVRLSQMTRRKVRLPTEAEWEFACRAGTSTRFYTGESVADLERAAWFSTQATSDAGLKVPNSLGLFDMLGNVYELCEDAYQPTYANAGTVDPLNARDEAEHVIRGGSYSGTDFNCTSFNRSSIPLPATFSNVGLRVVIEPPGSFVAPAPPAAAAAGAPAGPPTLARMAIPDEAAQQAALPRVRERNKADYDKEGTREGKIELAVKLLFLRDKDKETRYAVLREALRLSIAAGEGKLAVDAVNGLAQHFENVDAFKEKLTALKLAAANANDESAIQSMGLAIARCVDEFAANGRFEALKDYSELIGTFASKMKESGALKDALRNAERLNEAWPATQSALKKLQTAPDDPQANLLAGQYLCFRRSDWQTGLAALAKSADKTLKRLAELDLVRPGNPAILKSLAEEWWEISNTYTGFEQAKIRAHAAKLFAQARRKLPEAERPALQTRVQEFIASQLDLKRIAAERREPGKSGRAGGELGHDFKDLNKTPRVLIGLRVSTTPNIRSIQPIYVNAQGVKEDGPVFGTVSGHTTDVTAAPGYAVAGIVSTSSQVLQGFRVVFMRINGQVLDPTDYYESPWVGDTSGQDARHETGANFIIGIYGKAGGNADSVGFYSQR